MLSKQTSHLKTIHKTSTKLTKSSKMSKEVVQKYKGLKHKPHQRSKKAVQKYKGSKHKPHKKCCLEKRYTKNIRPVSWWHRQPDPYRLSLHLHSQSQYRHTVGSR